VLDPLTSLALMAAGAVLILVLRPLPRWGQRGAAQALRGNTRFSGWIAHLPRLTQEVRLYGVTDQVERRVADADEEANRGRYRQRLLYLLGPSLFKDGAVLVLLVVALAGDLDEGSAARVGAVVLLLVRALAQGQFVYSVHGQVVAAYPHLDRVDAVLGELRASPRPHGTVVPRGFEELRLDGVTFAYDDGRAGLRGVDLTVHRGEMLGVAGPSGGGKTTLVAVLLGLAEPASGRVTLDGVALGDLDPAAWSGMVGVVPQDAELVDGTLADNIRFYRDGVSDEAVRAAAEAARLDAFPEGFDTVLAEGAGVSGGQRQRIALARALVGSPQLLVLDEPTAALDPRTEALVRETLEDQHRRGTTLVIVAHRPTTLQACDRVVVIEGGVVQDVRSSGSKSSPS
jgi:ABC-type multidrug transport system fused ATPase/permease subunit